MIAQNDDKNTGRKILFVCTGNTCRSPMAEHYFNSEMKKNGCAVTSESRGICASPGSPMSANAKKVLAENGIPEPLHKSGQIDEDIVRESEIVYGMTIHHQARLREEFPEFKHKILCMPENIGDPYGGNIEVYEKCFESIKRAVGIIINSLTQGDTEDANR